MLDQQQTATATAETEASTTTRSSRSEASCVHHWVVEMAHGRESRGRCKRCGSERLFSNVSEGPENARGSWR